MGLLCSVDLREPSFDSNNLKSVLKKNKLATDSFYCPLEFRPSYLLLSPFYLHRAHIVYYGVSGDNLQQLEKVRSLNAPRDGSDRWRDAIFKWQLNWDWSINPVSGIIQAESISLKESTSVHLPCWIYSPTVAIDEKREWHRFVNALVLHEQTHLNNYIKCLREIEIYFAKIKQGKFEVTPAQADQELRKYIMKLNESDVSFDLRTNHGRAQGSLLIVTPSFSP